ncbi:MAG: smtB [Frankiales bacterium]|nr:smtB [Frankiales bacterium]
MHEDAWAPPACSEPEPAEMVLADYAAAAELLKALSTPVRLALLDLLGAGPRCVHQLVDALEVSQPLVSQHLRTLREVGLVVAQRRGREVAYHLSDDHILQIVWNSLAHTREEPLRGGRLTA